MRLLLAGLLLLIAHVANPKPKPEPRHNYILFENPLMAGIGMGNPLGMQGQYRNLGMTRMIHPLTGQVGYFIAEKPELSPMMG